MANEVAFFAQFIAGAVGLNGLTVTWDVERITRADGSRSALVTGGATNIVIGRRGLYGHLLSGADLSLYDYVATAITAGAADQKEISAMWTQWSLQSGLSTLTQQNVADALKLAPTPGAPAAESVNAHLDDVLADTGEIGVAGAGLTALGDARLANLDTTVSSRSTVAQVNVVLARIGAFTGVGLSTIMGWLRAMMRKTAALTPADVAGTFDNVTDSLEAIRDKIGSGTITVTGPVVTTDGDVVTYRGDTYLNEDGRAIDWESDDWPDLTGGSVKVIISKVAEFNGSVVTPVGTVKVRLELTATQSRSIAAGRHNFQVVATQSDGDVATLVAAAWVSRARAEV